MIIHRARGLYLKGYRKVMTECGRRLPATRMSNLDRDVTCKSCKKQRAIQPVARFHSLASIGIFEKHHPGSLIDSYDQ